MVESDPHGSRIFRFLCLHRIGVVEGATTVTPVDSIHRSLELVATDLRRLDKEGWGVALLGLQPRANDTHFGRIGHLFWSCFPETVEELSESVVILSWKAGGFHLPAQLKAEFDLNQKMCGKVVHGAESAARFLQHTMQGGMRAAEVAQGRGQHMGMADRLSPGFGQGQVDTAQCVPHPIAFDGAPDPVELSLAGSAEGLNGVDAGVSQASSHARTDSGYIVEVKEVEPFGEFTVIDGDKAVGLIALARELGDKAIWSQTNRGPDIGPQFFGQSFLDRQSFRSGGFRSLPVRWQFSVHFID